MKKYFDRPPSTMGDWLVLAVTVVELLGALLLLYFPGATLRLDGICGLGLTFQADGFRMVMALLTAAVWMMTTLPSQSTENCAFVPFKTEAISRRRT